MSLRGPDQLFDQNARTHAQFEVRKDKHKEQIEQGQKVVSARARGTAQRRCRALMEIPGGPAIVRTLADKRRRDIFGQRPSPARFLLEMVK